MLRKIVEGAGGFKLDHPRLAAVVTCLAKGVPNALTVTWHSPLSEQPPLFGVALRTRRLSYGMILESGEFAVNFLPLDHADLLAALGGPSGKEGDKFDRFHLAKEKASKISAPLLHDAYGIYECTLQEHHAYGDHELLVGKVVATHFDEAVLKDGKLDVSRVHPALYLSDETYATAGGDSVRRIPRGEMALKLQK